MPSLSVLVPIALLVHATAIAGALLWIWKSRTRRAKAGAVVLGLGASFAWWLFTRAIPAGETARTVVWLCGPILFLAFAGAVKSLRESR